VSYFVSTLRVAQAKKSRTRLGAGRRLYIGMARNAASLVEAFALPADRTVIMGAEIEI
jgi:K+ transporter